MIGKILPYAIIFIVGFFSCMLVSLIYAEIEKPLVIGSLSLVSGTETPGDWIKESQIHVYDNAVVIDVENVGISRYAPTGSMKPVLNENSNGIRIVPENPSQIDAGDIITFEQNNELIIHRVIEKGNDEEGVYFVTKGDNNNVTDGKIRFKDVKYVTIGILW